MKKGYLYIVVAIIMFSTFEVVLKYIAADINTVQLTLTRFSIGFIFLLPLALRTLKKRRLRLDRPTIRRFMLLGLIGVALSMPMLNLAVAYIDSNVAALIVSCNPVFVIFFAFLLLREPIKPRHIAALALELSGAFVIINPAHTSLSTLGLWLAIISTALFSVYTVLGKRKCAEYGGAVVTCGGFFCGSLILLVFILITHIPAVAQAITAAGLPYYANIPLVAGYTAENLPYVLYVSAGVAGLGFFAYFAAMETLPATVVSLVFFFKPVFAPLLAWWLHGELLTSRTLLGMLLIVVGSMCTIVPGLLETRRAHRAAQAG